VGKSRLSAIITTVKPVAVGFFPLDEQWQIDRSDYSHELSRRMVWLSTQVPYQSCQEVFARIGECDIPASSIWRQTQRHGKHLAQQVEHQQTQVSVERMVRLLPRRALLARMCGAKSRRIARR